MSRWALTWLSIFITGAVGFSATGWGARYALPVLPGGIAVAAMYRWGWRMWPAVLMGGVAIDAFIHVPLWVAASNGVGMVVGARSSVWLLDRNGFEPSFRRARDVPTFLVAAVAGMTLVPTVGMVGVMLSAVIPRADYAITWSYWWTNVIGGALLVGPPLIAISRQSLTALREHWVEGLIWIVGGAIYCAVILVAPGPVGRALVVMFGILLIVVGAIRFGLVVSALGAAAICSATGFSISFGIGVFGQYDEFPGRVYLLCFSATLIAASLIITALLAERDTAALEALRAERRYAQIFNGSPQAVWVHDPVTANFLLANEAAQRQYGWSLDEFLAGNISMLAPPGELHILPMHRPPANRTRDCSQPFETRHLTQDGRILEVEVWMRSIDLGGRPAELVFAIDVSERRAMGKALVDTLAGEQRRIAGEMHDGLGQELTGLALSLRALTTRAQRGRNAEPADLDDLAKLATRCIEGSKRIVQGLSPLSDAGGNLESALAALARRVSLSGTAVRFGMGGAALLAVKADALDHFYRIAQEAVQNALKHAAATAIDIELTVNPSDIRLSIVDNGRGLPEDLASRSGLGMRTMQFRSSAVGGTLTIETRAEGGTVVRCEAPQGNRAAA